jgi:hypothetical protein
MKYDRHHPPNCRKNLVAHFSPVNQLAHRKRTFAGHLSPLRNPAVVTKFTFRPTGGSEQQVNWRHYSICFFKTRIDNILNVTFMIQLQCILKLNDSIIGVLIINI